MLSLTTLEHMEAEGREVKTALSRVVSRMETIGRVSAAVEGQRSGRVAVSSLFREIGERFVDSDVPPNVEMELRVAVGGSLWPRQVQPCALLLTELLRRLVPIEGAGYTLVVHGRLATEKYELSFELIGESELRMPDSVSEVGLAIVGSLLRQLGAELVEERRGLGCRVLVTFPVAPPR